MAVGSFPAALYAIASSSSVVRVSGWSAPSFLTRASRELLKKGDGLRQPPGDPVRFGQAVERGEGVTVVGSQPFDLGIPDLF